MRVGVQVSISGKIYFSIERAKQLGCNTIQIFARNPRQFRRGYLKEEDVRIFKRELKKSKISPLVVHTPYTLNLASRKNFLYHISIREFTKDIKEAHRLGAQYIVIHPGSFRGNKEEGLRRIIYALRIVLKNTTNCSTQILLENTAGEGSVLGAEISQYSFIFRRLRNIQRIGLCLDTAHAWCAGYKINTKKGLDSFLEEIDEEIGIARIKIIHLNDTQSELGSRHDRHFHIGKGKIGLQGFKLIVNHRYLRNLPFILETPKKKELDDEHNLIMVRRLYRNELYQRNR